MFKGEVDVVIIPSSRVGKKSPVFFFFRDGFGSKKFFRVGSKIKKQKIFF